jgi:hypothetical protein
MPKPKYKISEYLLASLKSKLEEKLSFRIFSKLDCKKPSNLIQKSLLQEMLFLRIKVF